VGGSEKSRMMVVCVVNYPSSSIRGVAFHKVVRRYYSGDAGANKKFMMWNFLRILYTKNY